MKRHNMSGIRAALVAAVLVLGGCRSLPSGLVPIDSKLAEYVPSDAVMLAGVRLSDVRATATYKRFETSKGFSQFDEFKRHTGLDPRTDLSEILAASNGDNWIVACRGKFDPPAIEQRALKEGAQRMPHGKYTLIGRQEGAVVTALVLYTAAVILLGVLAMLTPAALLEVA